MKIENKNKVNNGKQKREEMRWQLWLHSLATG